MKAFSIKQPWATAIAQGHKTLEIRTWKTKYRGPLLICSSAKPAPFVKADFKRMNEFGEVYTYYPDDPENGAWNQYGKAICTVELTDCRPFTPADAEAAMCDFEYGLYAWEFQKAQEITPFPVKGKLSFFNVEVK